MVDRILDGYGFGGVYHRSPMDVVSIVVEQRDEGDLTVQRAKQHPGMKIHPTVADVLTGGTGKLAVDGVVYICEQGNYARNDKGQTLDPRYQNRQYREWLRDSRDRSGILTNSHNSGTGARVRCSHGDRHTRAGRGQCTGYCVAWLKEKCRRAWISDGSLRSKPPRELL
jgi:hypothetical protein